MRGIVIGLSVLLSASVGMAEDFVCGPDVRPQCAETTGATRYVRSVDPSTMTDPTCMLIPKAVTAAQRDLVEAVAASHPNGRCHLTVAGGLAAEMTQGEKDAVNAAIQAKADDQQAYEDLVTTNDLCNATRQDLETRKDQVVAALQGDIAAITDIATLKVELTDIVTRLINNDYKLMTCLRGRAGPPQ